MERDDRASTPRKPLGNRTTVKETKSWHVIKMQYVAFAAVKE
jgi:hypothetical protein